MIRISLFSLGAAAVYTLVIYGSFFTVFLAEFDMYVEEDLSNMTLLLERYYAPVTLGLGMLVAALVIGAFPRALAKGWKAPPCHMPHAVYGYAGADGQLERARRRFGS